MTEHRSGKLKVFCFEFKSRYLDWFTTPIPVVGCECDLFGMNAAATARPAATNAKDLIVPDATEVGTDAVTRFSDRAVARPVADRCIPRRSVWCAVVPAHARVATVPVGWPSSSAISFTVRPCR